MNNPTSSTSAFKPAHEGRPMQAIGPPRIEPSAGSPIGSCEQSAPQRRPVDSCIPLDASGARRNLSVSRLLQMIGIFVVGTIVGLGSAWWLMTRAQVPGKPVLTSPVSTPGTIMQGQSLRATTTVRGISASELPYDGAAPPLEPAALASDKATASVEVEAQSTQGMSSSSSPVPAVVMQRADVKPDSSRISPPTSPSEAAQQPVKVRDTAAPAEGKVTKTARTRSTAVKPARDREIERIKRQADDELKQKNRRSIEAASAKSRPLASQRGKQQAVAATSVRRAASIRVMLAQCERSPNFIRREQCMWRLCNGMWGKNGCPSYSAQSTSY
ncbi:MAG: hypothetical protein ACREX0_03815 [Noviherbaspirillum sp.]